MIARMTLARRAVTPCIVLAAACAGPPPSIDDLPPELRSVSVRATLEPGAELPDTATFSWMPASTVHLPPPYDAVDVESRIRATLEAELLRRGYFAAPGNRGDLWIGYAIAVEGAVDGAALDRSYGIDRRSGTTVEPERGALVVDIIERASGRPLWRGSATILTDSSLSEQLRQARVEHGIRVLLDRLKPGY